MAKFCFDCNKKIGLLEKVEIYNKQYVCSACFLKKEEEKKQQQEEQKRQQEEERKREEEERRRQDEEWEEEKIMEAIEEQEQIEQESLKIIRYFTSNAQCKMLIENFIKRNAKVIESIIINKERAIDFGTEILREYTQEMYEFNKKKAGEQYEKLKKYEQQNFNLGQKAYDMCNKTYDLYNERVEELEKKLNIISIDSEFIAPIKMLTRALIEDSGFDLEDSASITTYNIIVIMLINDWVADFKQKYSEFCEMLNLNDKDKCIEMFTDKFDKEIATEKLIFSFFLILYGIEPNENIESIVSMLYSEKSISPDESSIIEDLYDEKLMFDERLNKAYETVVYKNFKSAIIMHIDTEGESYTIDDIDLMDGKAFEEFIAKLFTKMGYTTTITKQTGDQGIDVIAKKGNTSIGIQTKCYAGSVGNTAVQEAVGGKAFHKVDKVMVVTNNEFTQSAKELAQVNSVILWDRSMLIAKLLEYQT